MTTYGPETWNLSVNDARKIRILREKFVRRIYNSVFRGNIWGGGDKSNSEIEEISNREDIAPLRS